MRIRQLSVLAAVVAVGLSLARPVRAGEGSASPNVVRTGEAASGYIVVTAATTEIFAAPTDDAASIGTAAKGDAFPLAGKQQGWYFVATSEATHGWIRSSAAATVFYPDYFAAPRTPDYSTNSAPAPQYPPYGSYPPYPSRAMPGPGMYPGYPGWDSGWNGWGGWSPLWNPFWWGIWSGRRDRGWGGPPDPGWGGRRR
jgi:hypothetical protein